MKKRKLTIDVDGIIITNPMAITVSIVKDAGSEEVDFATITILNLAQATRATLTEDTKRVAISGGYDIEALMFIGDIQSVVNMKKGTEWITTITAGDGENVRRQAIMDKTYNEPVQLRTLAQDLAFALGEAEAELIEVTDAYITGRPSTYFGSAENELNKLAEAEGLQWSIQDDHVVINAVGTGRTMLAYDIRAETGMIDTPQWLNAGVQSVAGVETPRERILVKSLLLPSLKPLDLVSVKSGGFQIRFQSLEFKNKGANEAFTGVVQRVNHKANNVDGEFITLVELTL